MREREKDIKKIVNEKRNKLILFIHFMFAHGNERERDGEKQHIFTFYFSWSWRPLAFLCFISPGTSEEEKLEKVYIDIRRQNETFSNVQKKNLYIETKFDTTK